MHRQFEGHWDELVSRVGLDQAQRFYDHVAATPGEPPAGISWNQMRGTAGKPTELTQGLTLRANKVFPLNPTQNLVRRITEVPH